MIKKRNSLMNLKPFAKGVSGNPGGRPKMPEDVKRAKRMTDIELIRLLNQFLGMSKVELSTKLKDPNATMMELTIGSIVLKAFTGSDHQRLDFLLTRMIGKAKEPVQEHTFNFQMMPRAQVIEMGREALKVLEAKGLEDDDSIPS